MYLIILHFVFDEGEFVGTPYLVRGTMSVGSKEERRGEERRGEEGERKGRERGEKEKQRKREMINKNKDACDICCGGMHMIQA